MNKKNINQRVSKTPDPNFVEFSEHGDNDQFSTLREQERLQKNFKDYLVVGEIAGTLKGVPKGRLVQAESVLDAGGFIELQEPNEEGLSEHTTQAIIHKNALGQIESVEILCSCGQKTRVILRFDEEAQDRGTTTQ